MNDDCVSWLVVAICTTRGGWDRIMPNWRISSRMPDWTFWSNRVVATLERQHWKDLASRFSYVFMRMALKRKVKSVCGIIIDGQSWEQRTDVFLLSPGATEPRAACVLLHKHEFFGSGHSSPVRVRLSLGHSFGWKCLHRNRLKT